MVDEQPLVAALGVDFGDGPQFAVRAEHEVGASCAPLRLLAAAVVADELLVAAGIDHFPEGVVVEQVDEIVVGELPLAGRQHTFGLVLVIGPEHAQAPDQHCHLRRRQAQQRGAVEQQLLGADAMLGLEIVAEAVGGRLHHRKALRIGPLRRGIAAPACERHFDRIAGVARRLLDRRRARQHDRIGKAETALEFADLRQRRRQFGRLVDLPPALRLQGDPRAIGAAAMVRLAIGRGRGPGRLDQLPDAQARPQDCTLESRDLGLRRRAAGRNRVLPDQRLGRDFRPEVADPGPHVAVAQFEPGASKGILERLMVVAKFLADCAEFRIDLQRHVGRRHHRRDPDARVMRGRRHVLLALVDRLPLLRSGGRANELIFIVHQQPEVILAPFGGRVDPRAFNAAGDGVLAEPALVGRGPAHAHHRDVRAFGSVTDMARIARAMRLAEGVPAGGQRDRLLGVHRHPLEGDLHVARRRKRVGIAARTFGIDVDESHLDRGQRMLQRHVAIRLDASFFRRDPLLLGAPIDVPLGLEHVAAAAAEAEHRPAHVLDGDIAGQDEQVGPADGLPVLLLDRPQQTARLVEIAVVRPAVERGEALLPAIGSAASIGGAIGARRMPGHADHEGPVIAVIGRPPRLAIGHQRGQIGLERGIIERVERFGVIEVGAHRIGRKTALAEDVDRQLLGPPILVLPPQQRARLAFTVERTAPAQFARLRVHVRPFEG